MPAKHERSELQVHAERAVLAAVRLPDSTYDPRDPFGELRELAHQAGAIVVGELTQRLEKPIPATYMGSGKVNELKALCETLDAKTIIFDHDLSPKQISNIEKETQRKVVDRSELILDIFASRATTREAQLQVEIAQLEYTYPRLKAMWDHLERIVGSGGIGGIGTRGPGEMQLEIDRRLVQRKKVLLKRELEEIQGRRKREVQARKREHFTVGIVGYTNAGKSTLFNTLTAGGAYADDRLFATLMTRTRQWDLGGGLSVMLSDTVGFVRDIPHHLVASFKATLEEATHADLLLIVLDVSDPACEIHYATVQKVLAEMFEELREAGETDPEPPRVVLLNKADKLDDNSPLLVWGRKVPDSIPLCSLPVPDALGQAALGDLVRAAAMGDVKVFDVTVPLADAKTISIIENRGEVLDRTYDEKHVTLRARIGTRQLAMLRSAGARLDAATTDGQRVEIAPHRADPARAGWDT
ncbi:MAG: GTPase HflX [Phycisphaerales bacterium]|nr:GTPase HflX [Phycisphaerales bacterium]